MRNNQYSQTFTSIMFFDAGNTLSSNNVKHFAVMDKIALKRFKFQHQIPIHKNLEVVN